MPLIEFNGYDNKPIYLKSSAILGVTEYSRSTEDDPQTQVLLITGVEDDYTVVRETVDIVRNKIEAADNV